MYRKASILAAFLLLSFPANAQVKLSAIANGAGINTSTDQCVAVRNGTTDVLVTLAASAGTDTTNATNITSGSLAYTRLLALSANQLLGSLTATTPSGQSVPSCSAAGNALIWTSGSGFGCATGYLTAGSAVSSVTGDGTIISNSGSTGAVTLTLANTPTGSGSVVLATGPTMTNPIVGTQAIGDNSTKAASTAFVQAQIAAQVDMHDPVQAATTGVLLFSPSYSNGSSGVGATLTATSVGTLIIDGYTPALNDRLLIKNQAASLQNGCYTLTTVGVPITTDYVLTRCTDFNQAANIAYGDTFPVLQGTANSNQQFTMNNQSFTTVGAAGATGNITFSQTSGGSQIVAGAGITVTGNSVAVSTNGLSRNVSVTFDGGGGVLSAGKIIYLASSPCTGTINQVQMLADQSGSAVVDVWKTTYAGAPPTVANTITAMDLPTLSSAQKSQDTSLTGWATSVTAGDTWAFKLNSATTITELSLVIQMGCS